MWTPSGPFQDARLVGWDHVLDVDESIRTSALLQNLQGLLDEVSNVLVEPLVVVDAVAGVHCTRENGYRCFNGFRGLKIYAVFTKNFFSRNKHEAELLW